jgi:hypothetical protein
MYLIPEFCTVIIYWFVNTILLVSPGEFSSSMCPNSLLHVNFTELCNKLVGVDRLAVECWTSMRMYEGLNPAYTTHLSLDGVQIGYAFLSNHFELNQFRKN